MNRLDLYLHPLESAEKKEVVISDRFINPDTKEPVKFTIRAVGAAENDALIRKATIRRPTRSGHEDWFDRLRYRGLLVVAGTADPEFANAELCAGFGVTDPVECAKKMLLMGEYVALENAIYDISKLTDPGNPNALDKAEEDAKN